MSGCGSWRIEWVVLLIENLSHLKVSNTDFHTILLTDATRDQAQLIWCQREPKILHVDDISHRVYDIANTAGH